MPAIDLYAGIDRHRDMPVEHSASITPSNDEELAYVTTAIYVGVAGDLAVVLVHGAQQIYKNVPVGWFPVRARQVKATGTLATELVAGW